MKVLSTPVERCIDPQTRRWQMGGMVGSATQLPATSADNSCGLSTRGAGGDKPALSACHPEAPPFLHTPHSRNELLCVCVLEPGGRLLCAPRGADEATKYEQLQGGGERHAASSTTPLYDVSDRRTSYPQQRSWIVHCDAAVPFNSRQKNNGARFVP